ncbi:MAG TPA: hypothetical protein DIC18_03720, partial [Clostridiales bacterium]|nr:hypothetical protein [Clostridiales bacterium]
MLSLLAAQLVLLGAVAAGAVFYSSIYVLYFSAWKITLIDITFALCSGLMVCLAVFERRPEIPKIILIIPFFVGASVFSGIYFGLQ